MSRPAPLPALQHRFRRFELDPFQAETLYHLDCGNSVLLAAPTGTGKTLVADYLVTQVLRKGKRLAYTAPVKALVNQKYRGFVREFGRERIGILTGDAAENPGAPVVIMTTEILRNQLAAGTGGRFGWVVFDEIHYLDHADRGNVWEQALLLLSPDARVLGLSATVPNAEEIAAWIGRVLGHPVALVRHSIRAVPLEHYYYHRRAGFIPPEDVFRRQAEIVLERDDAFDSKGGLRGATDALRLPADFTPDPMSSSHLDLLSHLSSRGLFPCLYFVFSRRGCEEKARQLARFASFLGPREKDAVRVAVKTALAESGLSSEDIPGFAQAKEMWARGIGVHHAGLLPVVKEIVETLLERRLLRVVYATETFAVGVNLPVRTVCFDSLRKYDGRTYRYLTQQEYFQMAGRAGRRGLDRRGMVVALADFASLHRDPPPDWDESCLAPIQSHFYLPDHVILNLTDRLGPGEFERFFQRSLAVFQGADGLDLVKSIRRRQSLLEHLDYLDARGLRPRGMVARRIFQSEVPVTELIFAGIPAELPAPDLAGLAAALVEEERQGETAYVYSPPPWLGEVEAALSRAQGVLASEDLSDAWLEPSLIPPVKMWCGGAGLGKVLRRYPQDPGDFVNRCRRAVDLLRQIGSACPELSERAGEASRLLDRGLVRVKL